MAKRLYRGKNFRPEARALIAHANRIIGEYQAQGLTVTLRQLYYQFVSQDLLPNKQENYKRLGDIINDARLAGLVDWEAIEDVGRYIRENPHWESPNDILDVCSRQFRYDTWADQPVRPEVWVEKDALIGIIAQAAKEEDCVGFSCKGYTSATSINLAARRILERCKVSQKTVILHLGDHDPSGVAMTGDVRDRIREMLANDWYREVMVPAGKRERSKFGQIFEDMEAAGGGFEVERIALHMEQVEEYNPPPNPAKETDPRFKKYQAQYGDTSWELDALRPDVLVDLIQTNIHRHRDEELWDRAVERRDEAKEELRLMAKRYQQVARFTRWLDSESELPGDVV